MSGLVRVTKLQALLAECLDKRRHEEELLARYQVRLVAAEDKLRQIGEWRPEQGSEHDINNWRRVVVIATSAEAARQAAAPSRPGTQT